MSATSIHTQDFSERFAHRAKREKHPPLIDENGKLLPQNFTDQFRALQSGHEDVKHRLDDLFTLITNVNSEIQGRFNTLENSIKSRFNNMDLVLESIASKAQNNSDQLGLLRQELDLFNRRFQTLDNNVARLASAVSSMAEGLSGLNNSLINQTTFNQRMSNSIAVNFEQIYSRLENLEGGALPSENPPASKPTGPKKTQGKKTTPKD